MRGAQVLRFDMGVSDDLTDVYAFPLGLTLGGRALYLVFTLRGSKIRLIAARDMNRKERQDYEQAKADAEKDPDV